MRIWEQGFHNTTISKSCQFFKSLTQKCGNPVSTPARITAYKTSYGGGHPSWNENRLFLRAVHVIKLKLLGIFA
jgi:hypothetical protein